jgi:hypothetical protein
MGFSAAAGCAGSDVAVAIDDHVMRIAVRPELRGQALTILGHHRACSWMLLQECFYRGLRLAIVDGNDNQTIAGKFGCNIVHRRLVAPADRTPCGEELQKHHVAA